MLRAGCWTAVLDRVLGEVLGEVLGGVLSGVHVGVLGGMLVGCVVGCALGRSVGWSGPASRILGGFEPHPGRAGEQLRLRLLSAALKVAGVSRTISNLLILF